MDLIALKEKFRGKATYGIQIEHIESLAQIPKLFQEIDQGGTCHLR